MQRRKFITILAGAALTGPRAATGQTTVKVSHIGTLTAGLPCDEKSVEGMTLISTLAERGYTLGKNLTFNARGARGQVSELSRSLGDLKAANVDVIVTVSYRAALAAKNSGIPVIVAFGSGDPVATGLVDSFAHPGGTVTGISDDAATISTKRLSLLKQMLPNMRRVAMLWNRDDLGMSLRFGATSKSAEVMGFGVQALGVREPDDFDGVAPECNPKVDLICHGGPQDSTRVEGQP